MSFLRDSLTFYFLILLLSFYFWNSILNFPELILFSFIKEILLIYSPVAVWDCPSSALRVCTRPARCRCVPPVPAGEQVHRGRSAYSKTRQNFRTEEESSSNTARLPGTSPQRPGILLTRRPFSEQPPGPGTSSADCQVTNGLLFPAQTPLLSTSVPGPCHPPRGKGSFPHVWPHGAQE